MPNTSQAARKLPSCPSESMPHPSANRTVIRLPVAISIALAMAAIGGRVNSFAGTYPAAELAVDPNLIHYRQLVVTGSHDFTPHHFTTALKLIQYGMVRVAPLISHRFPLDEVRDAFETTAGRRGLTRKQIGALARWLHGSPSVFLPAWGRRAG